MGAVDMIKLAMQARKMQAQMSKIKAAGQHGVVSVMVQAPDSKVVEHTVDDEALAAEFPNINRNELKKLANKVANDFKNALEAASKEMQKKLASSDDLVNNMKTMMSNS